MRSTYSLLWTLGRAYVRLLPRTLRPGGAERELVEQRVLRALFLDPDVGAILFAGCAGYKAWYPAVFRLRRQVRFATVDADVNQQCFGTRGDHHVLSLGELAADGSERNAFDVLLVDGMSARLVGSDDTPRALLDAAATLLRGGGRVIVVERAAEGSGRFEPAEIDDRRFVAATVPGLAVGARATPDGSTLVACMRHTAP